MKLTQQHLQFWNQQKAPAPGWAQKLERAPAKVSVHSLINMHDPSLKARDSSHVANNTMTILKMARKRGVESLADKLADMASCPGCAVRPERRAAYSRKWLRRVIQDRGYDLKKMPMVEMERLITNRL